MKHSGSDKVGIAKENQGCDSLIKNRKKKRKKKKKKGNWLWLSITVIDEDKEGLNNLSLSIWLHTCNPFLICLLLEI